jgi:protein SCO1/2
VRDVEPLNIGDPLPDYTFTNELGQAVSLAQFKGQALAITFIFTRCPFPTFCPQMSRYFRETQEKLKQQTSMTNWHLLTLSFDPEFDTPAVLKNYAEEYQADPSRWNFLTGALIDVTALTEQFGVQFWRVNPGEPLSHNLRTVVVDAAGRVQKIFPNNNWTSDELVAEMLKAAAVK